MEKSAKGLSSSEEVLDELETDSTLVLVRSLRATASVDVPKVKWSLAGLPRASRLLFVLCET